jgi:hypothetical protein
VGIDSCPGFTPGQKDDGYGECTFTVNSDVPVISTGIILTVTADDKFSVGNPTSGQQTVSFSVGGAGQPYTAVAYVTTPCGTDFSASVDGTGATLCLAAGTLVTLGDGTRKRIEDVVYDDSLLVWDFDSGQFAVSRPLWIKRPEVASQYNLLTFSDGSTLRTIVQHRIFNKEAGRFTYPMTEDTPIGTTTFNASGAEVTLVSKEIVREEVEYHNIITDQHFNLFADSVLTSCRLNNIYPIEGMMFVKDNRPLRPREDFAGIPDRLCHGLRLSEQPMALGEIHGYVDNLQRKDIARLDRAIQGDPVTLASAREGLAARLPHDIPLASFDSGQTAWL